jgi:hypothetical protein
MTRPWLCPARRAGSAAVALAAVALAGCGKPYDGVSDYDREQMARQAAAEAARAQGLQMTEKNYPLGKGWVVDMKGMTVTEGHFRRLKEVVNVAELDLSKSTITDDQLGQMREVGAAATLFKIDLSHTQVTDAGLERLEGLPLLANVVVTGTRVTAAGAEKYKKSRLDNPQIMQQLRYANVVR